MGVKDFCASVTPGSKPSELFGACNYKILPTGYERSQDIFEQQKVDTSPNGGVLNQVKSSDNKFIVLLNAYSYTMQRTSTYYPSKLIFRSRKRDF